MRGDFDNISVQVFFTKVDDNNIIYLPTSFELRIIVTSFTRSRLTAVHVAYASIVYPKFDDILTDRFSVTC